MLMHALLVAVPGFEGPTEGDSPYAGLQGPLMEIIDSSFGGAIEWLCEGCTR